MTGVRHPSPRCAAISMRSGMEQVGRTCVRNVPLGYPEQFDAPLSFRQQRGTRSLMFNLLN